MRAKYTLTMLVLTMLTLHVHAQTQVGVKAGVNFSDIAVSGLNLGEVDFLNAKPIAGITAGVYGEIPMGNGLYFSPELNYTEKGFRIAEGTNVNVFGLPVPIGAEALTRLRYVEAPLLLKYKFEGPKVDAYVQAGPAVGYAMSGDVKMRVNSIIDLNVAQFPLNLQGNLYNPWEVSAVAGAGAEFKTNSGKFFVDAKYSHGITQMLDDPVVDVRLRNKGLGMSVGYAFAF